MEQRRRLYDALEAVTLFLETDTDPFEETEYDDIFAEAKNFLQAAEDRGFIFD